MDSGTIAEAVRLAEADAEFRIHAAEWVGSLSLVVDGQATVIRIADGLPALSEGDAAPVPDADNIVWSADDATWGQLLTSPPPPFFTDPFGAILAGFSFEAGPFDRKRHAAMRRFCELLRHARNGTDPTPQAAAAPSRHGQHDAAVGRYIHLAIDGLDYRLYYEEAGSGIPLLCQHTAGADARQWRHFLEDERITSRFRVITYDLPYHGKSLPPANLAWWAEPYVLTRDFAMAVPNALASALGLDRPAFIGASVGGMLALDLARYHPDSYRAVIACEGGLKIDTDTITDNAVFQHVLATPDPAHHAELMMWVMAPQAPETFRQETRLHYAQGAPGVFTGDLNYFSYDHDLRGEADKIDTSRCPVYMLTGEYDGFTIPVSQEAAAAIDGAELQIMEGLGHFPMSEDPEGFATYVLPILDRIAAADS